MESDLLAGGKQAKPLTGASTGQLGLLAVLYYTLTLLLRHNTLTPALAPAIAHLHSPLPPDWRIVAAAPLRLTNQLPVAGSLLVWEQQAGASKELVGRQTVQVPSGATVPIHTGALRHSHMSEP